MSVTDELLANNAAYVEQFTGPLHEEIGVKPPWAAGSFKDLDVDVRQSIERIERSPYIPLKDSIRGFVFDVATGKLNEVV